MVVGLLADGYRHQSAVVLSADRKRLLAREAALLVYEKPVNETVDDATIARYHPGMRELPLPHRFFALLHKSVFTTDRHANALLTHENSHFSEFLMLNALECCADPSQQSIASFLNLTPAAVSRRIDALVRRGLAKRGADPQSRRTNRILLTREGRAELARMQKVLTRGFKEQIGALSQKEMKSVCRILETLLESFNRRTA